MERSASTRLAAWYRANARDLPWRRTRDPYAIWVSEVMLQQTRVTTVVPYFERFMAALPTVGRLARAREDRVMRLWAGLGYYRRARLLHRGAKVVVTRFGGAIPSTVAELESIPGIGRYTAGAIASIAFDEPAPIVDGNVARVLSRFYAIRSELGARETTNALWRAAGEVVKTGAPSTINQAVMELGATICVEENARCAQCPLRSDCAAHARDLVSLLPKRPTRRAPLPMSLTALRVRANDGALCFVRERGALYRGLVGLPSAEGRGAATARSLANELGLDVALEQKPTARIAHQLTHRTLLVELWDAQAVRLPKGRSLIASRNPDALPLSALTKKLLRSEAPYANERNQTRRRG